MCNFHATNQFVDFDEIVVGADNEPKTANLVTLSISIQCANIRAVVWRVNRVWSSTRS